LHATEVSFIHPVTGTPITIKAEFQPEFTNCLAVLGFSKLQ